MEHTQSALKNVWKARAESASLRPIFIEQSSAFYMRGFQVRLQTVGKYIHGLPGQNEILPLQKTDTHKMWSIEFSNINNDRT